MPCRRIFVPEFVVSAPVSVGNLGQAELIGREALKLLPNDHTIMFSLANVLGKQQKYKVGDNVTPCG